MKKIISGNEAAAYGVLLSQPDVIAVYPITPSSSIMEKLAGFHASGKMRKGSRFIEVESEHSAMACCIGAETSGARAFTATSSQGLAYMHEMLHWAGNGRQPVVLANVNRTLAPPWIIWNDQSDSLSQRDTGWIQLYCENAQEVLDSIILAYKVGEASLHPAMVCLDGFYLSHTYEPVEIPDAEKVSKFLLRRDVKYKLDPKEPHAFGGETGPDNFMEFRYLLQKSMESLFGVYEKAESQFNLLFKRKYGFIESYRIDDAEDIIVTSGTVASTGRDMVDELRKKGEKIGMLKIKMFRPFPAKQIAEVVKEAKNLIVIDRNLSAGRGGIFASEISASLCNERKKPDIYSFIGGLGGRDITVPILKDVFAKVKGKQALLTDINWIDIKLL